MLQGGNHVVWGDDERLVRAIASPRTWLAELACRCVENTYRKGNSSGPACDWKVKNVAPIFASAGLKGMAESTLTGYMKHALDTRAKGSDMFRLTASMFAMW